MQILGHQVPSALTNGDPSVSKYGTHYSHLGIGGYQEVLTETQKEAIPVDSFLNSEGLSSGRRRLGMRVYVVESKKTYVLGQNVNYSSWISFTDAQKISYLADNTNWSQETSLGGVPLSKILFVNQNGSTEVPEKGNINKPYQHPNLAKLDAVSGDYVIVLGGTFNAVEDISLQGGLIGWSLKYGAVLNFKTDSNIINHGDLESQTYIWGTEGSQINNLTSTLGTTIRNLHSNSIVSIQVDSLNTSKSFDYSCKSFTIITKTWNHYGSSAIPLIGTLPSNSVVKISTTFENKNTDSSVPVILVTGTDTTSQFFITGLYKDKTSGTSSTFHFLKFANNTCKVYLDSVQCELKAEANLSIDSFNSDNTSIQLLSPVVVNKPWGSSGSGSINFVGSTITDTITGDIFDASTPIPSKVISTDIFGNKVQVYSISTDQALSAFSDTIIPTQKAIKFYVDSKVFPSESNSGVKIRGSFVVDTNPANYPTADEANAVNGTQTGSGSTVQAATKASGEFLITQYQTGDTFTVYGVDFIAGTDFVIDGFSIDTTSENLVTAINDSTEVAIDGIILASKPTPTSPNITIESVSTGVGGNSITLSVSGPSSIFNSVSSPTLTGGQDGEISIKEGDAWFIKDTVDGEVGPVTAKIVNNGDLIISLVSEATNNHDDWIILDSASVDATESQKGVIEIATQTETNTGTDNERAITPLKLTTWWTSIKAAVITFAAKITFTAAPRFSSVTANQILAVDGNKDLVSKVFDADDSLASDSDDRIPTQKAIKFYVDNNLIKKMPSYGVGLLLTTSDDGATFTFSSATIDFDGTLPNYFAARFPAGISSLSGTSTINMEGTGAKLVKKENGGSLISSDIINGQTYFFLYDNLTDQYRIQGIGGENITVINDLTTGGTTTALSAQQGVVLKGLIDTINTLLTSDEVSLDTLQEVVDAIKNNQDDLGNLNIASISGLESAIADTEKRGLRLNGRTANLSGSVYTATSPTGLEYGQQPSFLILYPTSTNTGASTLSLDAIPSISLRRWDDTELQAGDIVANKPVILLSDINGRYRCYGVGIVGGTGSKHTIQDNGVDVADRPKLNIVGATVEDDLANNATVITFQQKFNFGGLFDSSAIAIVTPPPLIAEFTTLKNIVMASSVPSDMTTWIEGNGAGGSIAVAGGMMTLITPTNSNQWTAGFKFNDLTISDLATHEYKITFKARHFGGSGCVMGVALSEQDITPAGRNYYFSSSQGAQDVLVGFMTNIGTEQLRVDSFTTSSGQLGTAAFSFALQSGNIREYEMVVNATTLSIRDKATSTTAINTHALDVSGSFFLIFHVAGVNTGSRTAELTEIKVEKREL